MVALHSAQIMDFYGIEDDLAENYKVQRLRRKKWNLPVLYFSCLRLEGRTLSCGAEQELLLDQRRKSVYMSILSGDERKGGDFQVLKGSSIESLYPRGVQRPTGDVDFLVVSDSSRWKLAARIVAMFRNVSIQINYFGWPQQTVIALQWDSEDNYHSDRMSVDLVSTPFTEKASGHIAHIDQNTNLLRLLCIAEERRQRAFHFVDLYDIACILEMADTFALDDFIYLGLRDAGIEMFEAAAKLFPKISELALTYSAGLTAQTPASACSVCSSHSREECSDDLFSHQLRQGGQWNSFPLEVGATSAVPYRRRLDAGFVELNPLGAFLLVADDQISSDLVHRSDVVARSMS